MYCRQCGNQLQENQKFCINCGTPINAEQIQNNLKNDNTIRTEKNIQVSGQSKKIILFLSLAIFIVLILIITSNKPHELSNDKNTTVESVSNSTDNNEATQNAEPTANPNLNNTVQNELAVNMAKAFLAIQIDGSQIKKLEKQSDWNGGPLYTFTYKQNRFYVYANQDNTIASIRIGLMGITLYNEGFTPLNANDYIVDDSIATQLSTKIQMYVKQYLNYPETAEFPILDGWGYSRVKDVYGVSGYVKAKNAFGVEDRVQFAGQFRVKDNSYELVYLTVAGEKKFGNNSQIVEEMTELPVVTSSDNSVENKVINLVDGVKGEYGKTVKISNYEYVKYFVPIGKYRIVPKTKNALVFLDDVKTTQNYEGYEESINYKTYRLEENPDDNIVEVKKNTCIALGLGTKVDLISIEE